VLLVEDDASHAMLIKRALRDFAQEVEHVGSLAQALQALTMSKPQVLVVDLNLPDSRGVSHLKSLKNAAPEAAILVLTSSTSLADAVEAMKLGARDYIVKNFDAHFKEVLGLALMRLYTTLTLEADKVKLEGEMHVLRIAIQNSNDGLAVVDSQGGILYSNGSFEAFLKICGGDSSNIISICTERVVHSAALRENLKRNLKGLPAGAAWSSEVTFAAQKEAAYELGLSVVHPDPRAQRFGGLHSDCRVLWLKDISEQKRRERFQREILSTTTHDLKGPLGAITVCVDLLEDCLKEPSKTKELVMRIGSSATSALNLIDEFLSARRIQEGTFILKPAGRDVMTIVQEIVDNNQAIAQSKGVKLEVERGMEKLEALVDGLGLGRVITNLVSNALKFTPKGGQVVVALQAMADEYRIAVRDSGCGIEPGEMHKLFERFSRLEKHGGVAGTGLGLYVAKSIVAAHGGRIDVTSKVGQGSVFEVVLPYQPPLNDRGELISLEFK
jgi:signal transduction histidine kinase/ActR/RegA family two-component response regulator